MCTIKLASRGAQACRSAATDMGATMLHRDQTLQMLSAHPEWLVGLDGMGLVCSAHLISIYVSVAHTVMLLLFLWGLPWCMLLLLLPLLSCLFILLVCVCFGGYFCSFVFPPLLPVCCSFFLVLRVLICKEILLAVPSSCMFEAWIACGQWQGFCTWV